MRQQFKPPAGKITLSMLQSLLKKMPYIRGICIMGLCEPLLNDELPDILRWLQDEGHYGISLTTNGMVTINDDMLDALTRVGTLVFSIDTADEETFKYLRGGAELKKVMGNLIRVIEYKHAHNLDRMNNPPIYINAVMTRRNFAQVPRLIEMLEPYAADLTYLMLDPVSRPDYQRFESPLMLAKEEIGADLERFRRIAKESPLNTLGLDYMLEGSSNWGNCYMAWDGMFIEPNGDAYFCYNYDYVIGNVFKEDPLQVWNSSRAQEFRQKLLSSNPPLEQCHSCNFARSGWQPEGDYARQKLNRKDIT
jgi:radical SAM protein with 4Fe4S-binding SPASM domain